ncbi:MAG: CPBP family intramembrane metalloprotease [Cytophagales bacterium]|nr:CPBP family intramembrane metalloprotease [Cytophagales bacterium]
MYKFDNQLMKSEERSVFLSLFLLLAFLIVGIFGGSVLGLICALPFADWDIERLMLMMSNPTEDDSLALLVMQGGTAFTAFILCPLFYLFVIENKRLHHFQGTEQSSNLPYFFVFAFLLFFASIPFTSKVMEWNQAVEFSFLSDLEMWFKEKEEQAKVLTQILTTFHSPFELVLGVIVVAGFAAVGEELVFRGMLQNILWRGTKNIHIAIWVTGFIFSAIHLQFYGLIPRMILGVLFGYYYYWSRNLWVPIFAHFINNAFTVIALHLYKTGAIETNVEDNISIPFYSVMISVVLSAIILYYYKRMSKTSEIIS